MDKPSRSSRKGSNWREVRLPSPLEQAVKSDTSAVSIETPVKLVPPPVLMPQTERAVGNIVFRVLDEVLQATFTQFAVPFICGVVGAIMLSNQHMVAAITCFIVAGVWLIASLWRTPLLRFPDASEKTRVRIIGTLVLIFAEIWFVRTLIADWQTHLANRIADGTAATEYKNRPPVETMPAPPITAEIPPKPTRPSTAFRIGRNSVFQLSGMDIEGFDTVLTATGDDMVHVSNSRKSRYQRDQKPPRKKQ